MDIKSEILKPIPRFEDNILTDVFISIVEKKAEKGPATLVKRRKFEESRYVNKTKEPRGPRCDTLTCQHSTIAKHLKRPLLFEQRRRISLSLEIDEFRIAVSRLRFVFEISSTSIIPSCDERREFA